MVEIQNSICEIQSIGRRTRELLIRPEGAGAFGRHGVRLAGVSRAATDFRFVRECPDMGQYLVCFRGEGRVFLNGEWVRCGEGQAYLTPPGKVHGYRSGRRWEVGWVMVEPGAWPARLVTPELREVNPAAFEWILLGLHEESSGDAVALDHWVELLMEHCRRAAGPGQAPRLRKLWQQVQEDLAFAWTLDELARAGGVGVETLRQICHTEQGRSPMGHVRRLRMERAALLLGTGQKVEATAHAVGYENAFAFSVAFKKEMGESPGRRRMADLGWRSAE